MLHRHGSRQQHENKLAPPFFPLDVLKEMMMQLLTDAVDRGGAHIRDPIGGSNENLFVCVPVLLILDLEED